MRDTYLSRGLLTQCPIERRFATFKLFYHDHTPDDYEPPHFRSGDAQKDKWFFSTHDSQEAPEKCSVGQVQTGWHGVDLRVASVSGYLPSAEDNNAPFCGTTDGNGRHAPPLTPAEEATARLQQMALQKQDALERNVVWDAEEGLGDIDAEAEEGAHGTMFSPFSLFTLLYSRCRRGGEPGSRHLENMPGGYGVRWSNRNARRGREHRPFTRRRLYARTSSLRRGIISRRQGEDTSSYRTAGTRTF